MEKHFARVLLIDQSFRNNTAGGVTLTNLYYDWPKDKIAIADNQIDIDYCEKVRPCAMYYNFKQGNSGDCLDNYPIAQTKRTKNHLIISSIKKIRHYFSERIGYSDLRKGKIITTEFLSFIDEFKPDLVYSALGDLQRVSFIIELKKIRDIPLVIHIWDDWPDSCFINRWFVGWWRKKYDIAFRNLLSKTNLNLSICQTMSDAYKKRYGYDFIPFHNPVDLSLWNATPIPKKAESTISFLYMGKINKDTRAPLLDMCKAINILCNEGYSLKFDVYSRNLSPDNIELFSRFKNCNLYYSSLAHNKLPELLKSYSFMFLTLSFEPKSVQYTKFSMLTKLTEYLASQVPILLYCPQETALYKYSQVGDWAFWCDKGVLNLCNAIKILLDNPHIGNQLSKNAYATVLKSHTTEMIREQFRMAINSATLRACLNFSN